jgi:hypothetical protein
MATTTPNFGWSVPTSTDLVKDGAVAIETLGDSIDASLVDLKGGTTGQVLAKASGTDMDFSWVAQDDSNAIQNALLTTTGDTIYASAASTPARLGVGTDGQVLTVAGGVPTWATPGGALDIAQIATGSLSGSGVSLTSLSSYDTLMLRISGANVSSNDQNIRLYANTDNSGSNWEYAVMQTAARTGYNASDFDGYRATSGGWFGLTTTLGLMSGNTTNSFFMTLTNCKSAGMTFVTYWSNYRFSAGGVATNASATGQAIWKTEAAISSLQFNSQFNTFSAGTYTLWGA